MILSFFFLFIYLYRVCLVVLVFICKGNRARVFTYLRVCGKSALFLEQGHVAMNSARLRVAPALPRKPQRDWFTTNTSRRGLFHGVTNRSLQRQGRGWPQKHGWHPFFLVFFHASLFYHCARSQAEEAYANFQDQLYVAMAQEKKKNMNATRKRE